MFKSREAEPEFHPQTVLRDWGNGQAFRLADAQTGVCVFGATGSGKTSGPAKHLCYGYLANDFGGLVLCAKKEERAQWEAWAKECGRSKDLIIFDQTAKRAFNFLDWEASRPSEGGGFTINVVQLLDEVASAISGNTGKSGGDHKFWEDALHNLNSNLVDLPVLAGLQVSLPLLRDIVSSAPLSPEQANDPEWKGKSICAQVLKAADEETAKGDAEARADFEECRTYWTKDFASLAEKTRSSILLGFTVLIRPLVTRPLRALFSGNTNVKPEDTFDGKIIIVDLAVQEFRLAGRIANLIWKHCFQSAVLRRVQPADRKSFLRPVFLWADEAQNFVTRSDSEYQAVARSAGGCTVYLTQNIESFRRVLGNNDAVDSLLGNLQCKFFCQNSGDTNDWASRLLGQRYVYINSSSIGGSQAGGIQNSENPQGNFSVSRAEDRRSFVEPSRFTTLKRGGDQNNFQVEAIVYNGGALFQDGPNSEPLPYRLLTFNQK
jgi:type IV secretory pathway TraG/TraD family ATPase VirD4